MSAVTNTTTARPVPGPRLVDLPTGSKVRIYGRGRHQVSVRTRARELVSIHKCKDPDEAITIAFELAANWPDFVVAVRKRGRFDTGGPATVITPAMTRSRRLPA